MINDLQTIKDVSHKLRAKELSPVALVEDCLSQIDSLNPKLNAFITVLRDKALAQARVAEKEIQAGKWRSPLHGIPVAVKDFYDTAGIKTTGGFEAFKNRIPDEDAPVVAKLKEAGAIIVGKTNMDALGMETTGLTSAFGPIHNPLNADYVTGGSSAGSAVAVATGMCFATIDTDAVGSTRLPAACCGVVGLKASAGLINGEGVLKGTEDPGEMIHLLSHVGITARTVEDAALVLTTLSEKSEHNYGTESSQPDRSLRLGIARNFTATDEVRKIFSAATDELQKLGYSISEVGIPLDKPKFDSSTITEDRAHIDELLFKNIDVLLLPTLTEAVPTIAKAQAAGQQAVSPANTFFVNYFSLMAISIPDGFTVDKLPQGLQLVSKAGNDTACLKVACDYQQAAK